MNQRIDEGAKTSTINVSLPKAVQGWMRSEAARLDMPVSAFVGAALALWAQNPREAENTVLPWPPPVLHVLEQEREVNVERLSNRQNGAWRNVNSRAKILRACRNSHMKPGRLSATFPKPVCDWVHYTSSRLDRSLSEVVLLALVISMEMEHEMGSEIQWPMEGGAR